MTANTNHNDDDRLRKRLAKLIADAELTHAKMDAARVRMEATEAEAFVHFQEVLSRVDAVNAGLDKMIAAQEAAMRRRG